MQDSKQEKIQELLTLYGGDLPKLQSEMNEYARKHILLTESVKTQPFTIPMPTEEDIITLEDVSKTYRLGGHDVNALNDLTFSIKKGEFVAITGASGSGKSTLLHIIGCLDKPTTGSVRVESNEVTRLSDAALSELRQKSIGFIFQSFYLQPFLRVKDNLAVPAMFTKQKKIAIDAKVARLLERVDLSDRAMHFPKELSGGQIQRAAIARALVNNPRIILADEPTGNLDSKNSASIIDLFRTIRDQLGTTIVVVTHDLNIARQADRVIELKDGAIV